MSRGSFNELVALMAPFMSPKEHCVRQPILLEKRVAIALCKMASYCEYRVVANQFGIHKSSVKKCVYMLWGTLVEDYLKEFIRLPSTQEAAAIANIFEVRCHLPHIFVANDGSHIPTKAPKKGVNRKMWTSYNMQATVDDRRQ